MNNIYNKTATGLLGIMLIILFVFLCWMICPYKTIDFEPVGLVKTEYQVGEPLLLEFTYCKYTDLPAEVTKQFIDGVVFTLPYAMGNCPA